METSIEPLAIAGGVPVRTEPLPWELPGAHWIGSEELELVTRVIKAKSPFRYYGLDPQHMVDTLEEAYRKRLGRRFALATNSGTSALTASFNAIGVGPGDEVLVPGYLWVSCLSAIVRLGAIPKLVDIDSTFCMDPEDLARKITDRSKAVLLVHMSGAPGHLDKLVEVARSKGLAIVEDCAQANGAKFDGKLVGGFGDLAIFSFQANKNMTSGEGGLLVCDDEHLYRRCFAVHDMGYARNNEGRLDPQLEAYQLWGTGSRMSEISAAVALAQLSKLDEITASMRNSKWKIREQLADIAGLTFRTIVDPLGDSGPFIIVTLESDDLGEQFAAALHAEGIRGPEGSLACISTKNWGLHWYFNNPSLVNRRGLTDYGWPWTDPANDFARDYTYSRGALPYCDSVSGCSVLLTIASCLTDRDIDDIVKAFQKVADHLL